MLDAALYLAFPDTFEPMSLDHKRLIAEAFSALFADPDVATRSSDRGYPGALERKVGWRDSAFTTPPSHLAGSRRPSLPSGSPSSTGRRRSAAGIGTTRSTAPPRHASPSSSRQFVAAQHRERRLVGELAAAEAALVLRPPRARRPPLMAWARAEPAAPRRRSCAWNDARRAARSGSMSSPRQSPVSVTGVASAAARLASALLLVAR